MATTQPEDLVDTIRSRSQHFHFRALTFAEIAGRLEEIAQKENLKIAQGAMAVIARMAEGSLRDALSLLEQARGVLRRYDPGQRGFRICLALVAEDDAEELIQAIATTSADRALGLVHTVPEGRAPSATFLPGSDPAHAQSTDRTNCGADSELIRRRPDQRPALAKSGGAVYEEDLTRFFQICSRRMMICGESPIRACTLRWDCCG